LRVLYLSQLVPYPPDSGAKVRQYFALRYLTQRHTVTLVAFARDDDMPEAIEHLKTFCKDVHTVSMKRTRMRDLMALTGSWMSSGSFIIRRDTVPEMVMRVENELLSGYDLVHADQLWMAQYALLAEDLAREGRIKRPRLVLDEHNACYQIFQRLAQGAANPLTRAALEREWRALQRYEAQACARFNHVVTVTEEDRAILQGMVNELTPAQGEAKRRPTAFSTIPICVDTQEVQAVKPAAGSLDVLHLGTMFWPPNVEGVQWFGREVWTKVREQLPEATFTVVGKNPPDAIRALESQDLGVTVTGYVPDPQPYLERAGAFIVPLFSAGGMRVKIVDAWRWGLPIVSTTIGAEGLRYLDGENILIADDAEAFAAALKRVLQDEDLNRRLRENGRRWVEEQYDWQRVYPAWDEVYTGAAA
jgi:glycosyltransferase involved in cell wall biosynthesis